MVNPTHFDLQSLRVFVLVAEYGSLTKAAERGQLTLSAISKRVAELEGVTDCALLIRRPRGVELTAAGRGLLEHAKRVLDQVNSMANEMGDYAIGVLGHVTLWANTSSIVQFLPVDLARFLDANHGIKINLEERLSGDIIDALQSGKADLGVFADNLPAYGIEKRLYRQDELVVLVPSSHALAREDSIEFARTLDEDYVGLTAGSSLLIRMTDAAFAAGRPLKLRIQMSSFDGICRMIENGLGIGILPRAAIRPELIVDQLRIVGLTDAWATRTLWIGANDRAMSVPEVARLYAFLSGASDPANEAPDD